MSLDALVRSGVAIAKSVTADLQVTVEHEAWTGVDGYAAPTYASAKKRQALVERTQRVIRTATGENQVARVRVLFLEPIKANGADGRVEPIDPRDRLTLPDGTVGQILDVSGMFDPTTDAPYFCEVFCG